MVVFVRSQIGCGEKFLSLAGFTSGFLLAHQTNKAFWVLALGGLIFEISAASVGIIDRLLL